METTTGFGPDIEQRYTIGEPLRRDDKLLSAEAVDSRGRDVVLTFVVPRQRRRFLDEARMLSGVVHPVVAPILEWGVTEGRCYIARQSVEGTPLSQILAERRSVPWREAVGWATEVAAGLGALHTWGAVHGGVSPHTIVVTPDQSVRLIDAGLARASWPSDMTALDPPRAAHYKTPEEVLARELTPASDVYALGLVLYHLVTGVPPFNGRTALDVAERQVGSDPALPSRRMPEVPEALERVIMRALAKQPEDRYANADLLRRDLERAAAGLPVSAPPAPGSEPLPERIRIAADTPIGAERPGRPRFAWVLAILTVVAALILGALLLFGGSGESTVPELSGLTIEQARARLDEEGLELGAVSLQPGPVGSVAGTVFAQEPLAGVEVGGGSRVNVTVASTTGATAPPAEATTTAPSLLGLTQAEAEQAAQDAGFILADTISVYHSVFPAGQVAGQVPSAGQPLPVGGNIAIAVSMGAAPAGTDLLTVPGVLGTPSSDAATRLQGLGFVVVVWEQAVEGQAAGVVVGQCPGDSAQMSPGGTVIILVSSAVAPAPAPTPAPTLAPVSPAPPSPLP
jgi:serine/threonine-protein kinase